MGSAIRMEPIEVRDRLRELGLDQAKLAEVVRRGYYQFITCTPNDPPLFPGFSAWAMTVRALREYLVPEGWRRSDENNYSLVINDGATVAIAVSTGDDATGQADRNPSTKSSKGPSTIDAVSANRIQLSLFADLPALPASARAPARDSSWITWILLVHRSTNEVRCELSLPSSMGEDGRVDEWQERIILGSLSLDTDFVEETLPALPDITVEVTRRA